MNSMMSVCHWSKISSMKSAVYIALTVGHMSNRHLNVLEGPCCCTLCKVFSRQFVHENFRTKLDTLNWEDYQIMKCCHSRWHWVTSKAYNSPDMLYCQWLPYKDGLDTCTMDLCHVQDITCKYSRESICNEDVENFDQGPKSVTLTFKPSNRDLYKNQ